MVDIFFIIFLTFIPMATGLTNDFHLFEHFIVCVFVKQGRANVVTSHIFTPLFMITISHLSISRLRLVYWSILKIAND